MPQFRANPMCYALAGFFGRVFGNLEQINVRRHLASILSEPLIEVEVRLQITLGPHVYAMGDAAGAAPSGCTDRTSKRGSKRPKSTAVPGTARCFPAHPFLRRIKPPDDQTGQYSFRPAATSRNTRGICSLACRTHGATAYLNPAGPLR